MPQSNSYALIREMQEVPALLRRFDPTCVKDWLPVLAPYTRILVTGEGSSRILPAKNLIARQWKNTNSNWHFHTEGARQAKEYALDDVAVIGLSNSGQTRELIDLFTFLQGKNTPLFGVTATPGSRLTELCDRCIVMKSGKEEAVAATKTVVEQTLILQALLRGSEWQNLGAAADACEKILAASIPEAITQILANASMIYFAGRNNGVAEELTLKINEITRKKSAYLEGTYVVHGIEEVMQASEVLVLVDPYPMELEKIQQVIEKNVGMKVIAIANKQTIFPTLVIPQLDGFDVYFQLLAGWTLLTAAGLANQINLDKPERARKVGNAV